MALQALRGIARALSRPLTPNEVADVVVEHIHARFGPAMSVVYVTDGTDEIHLVGSRGFTEEARLRLLRMPLATELPVMEAIRSAQPIFCESVEELLARFPLVAQRPVSSDQLQSVAAIPFTIDEHVVGALGLSFASKRELDELEREVLSTVGDLAAHAIDRYRLDTAEKKAQDTLRLLAEASTILASSLDYDTTLASITRLAVPSIADWATVDMLDASGRLRRLAVAHVDPAKVELGYEVTKRYPVDMSAPHGIPNVIRTGHSEMVSAITDDLLESTVADPELLRIIHEIGLRSVICVPLKARGRAVGALSVYFAESGRHYTDDDLRILEDLGGRASIAIENALFYRAAEEASRAKDEFLAVVSHELRTPLNSMLGWIHMLKHDSLPPDRRVRAMETIERNARAQHHLVEDLLDVSRIVSGKLRLDVQPVDLPLVIERAMETVRPAAAAKGITIKTIVDSSASPVSGDPHRLQQVVWNLLSNAVKFSDKGTSVQLVLQRLESTVEIAVSDRGHGVDPSFLPHVFERFRQADSSTTRKGGGLGLGLAIVRNLVELHGGSVRAESDGLGKGSRFVVRLPIAPLPTTSITMPPAIHPTASKPSYPRELEGLHVLVVDDEDDARELVAELLTECNVKVSSASNVRDALRLVESVRPTIIVSDIGMPEEDGYVLIRELRALPSSRGGNTPAIALTAYVRAEDRTKALVAGFNTHLPKPVEPAELLAVLASLTAVLRS